MNFSNLSVLVVDDFSAFSGEVLREKIEGIPKRKGIA